MNLHTASGPLKSVKADALVIFAYSDDKKCLADCRNCGTDDSIKLMNAANADGRFKGGAKETVFFRSSNADGFSHVLFVGIGAKTKVREENLRVAMAVATKTLAREKIKTAAVCLESVRRMTKSAEKAGRAMSEGALLASYKYDELKTKKDGDKDKGLTDITFVVADKAAANKFKSGMHEGAITAEFTNFARDLANAPGNYMTPAILADRAEKASKGLGIKFKALDKKQISALKMGCLLGVNSGSTEEPRFIVMEYFGGKKTEAPLVFVGKGLTFDTGGISIKPSAAMEEMKFDMCGGAAVIATILAAAKLKVKRNIVGIVPSTENMPDGAAVKPGDVLVAMNGKTVEVNNTDAEGRLILADALAYACEKYKPAAIFDAATLTGACVIALGNVFSGFFCKDDKLVKKIHAASEESGERIWQLPLVDEYVDDMRGTYADLTNMGTAKGGGSSQGAAFLSQFVDEKIPWAHFDIAGSAYHTGSRYPYNPDKGASGSAVRLFVQLIENK